MSVVEEVHKAIVEANSEFGGSPILNIVVPTYTGEVYNQVEGDPTLIPITAMFSKFTDKETSEREVGQVVIVVSAYNLSVEPTTDMRVLFSDGNYRKITTVEAKTVNGDPFAWRLVLGKPNIYG